MEIKREGDSISFSDLNTSGVVSAIKMETNSEAAEKSNVWVKKCADMVQPNPHSFHEVEDYIYKKYELEPLEQEDMKLQRFKAIVIVQSLADHLENKPPVFSPDLTDEELIQYFNLERAQQEEALTIPAERFDLKLHGYRLTDSTRNDVLRQADLLQWTQIGKPHHPKPGKSESLFFLKKQQGLFPAAAWAAVLLSLKSLSF